MKNEGAVQPLIGRPMLRVAGCAAWVLAHLLRVWAGKRYKRLADWTPPQTKM